MLVESDCLEMCVSLCKCFEVTILDICFPLGRRNPLLLFVSGAKSRPHMSVNVSRFLSIWLM